VSTNRVYGGTPTSGTICRGCRHAIRMRTSVVNERIYCEAVSANFAIELREPVFECTSFKAHGPSLYHLQETAWTLNLDRTRGKVGFSPPKQEGE
jgi:hypothetical protein